MEPKKMFLDSFCKKGLYIESFGRPSPLYPSLTPGSMHTLQCERCCVHPWVKFEKKNSGNQFEKQTAQPLILVPSRNFWRFFFSWISDVMKIHENPVFLVFSKNLLLKNGNQRINILKGCHLGYRVPIRPAVPFVSLHWVKHLKNLWNLREIGGNAAKS